MQVALVLFPGVSIDECEAFTLAFDRLDDCTVVGVGHELGDVVGIGGRRTVEARFDDVVTPDVVLVPGGLGVERTAHDEELLGWLRRVEPTCQWIAASSTGTVVVAAAGLLGDRPAATHWLAGPQLAAYGSAPSDQRIVEVGHVLTCHGRISAMDVALLMILRLRGRDTAARVRSQIAETRPDRHGVDRWGDRWRIVRSVRRLAARRRRPERRRPRNEQLDSADWIEMELVELPD